MEEANNVTISELARSLARIEAKLDAVTGDHERRLRRVEMWLYASAGAGGIGAVSGLTSLFGGGP